MKSLKGFKLALTHTLLPSRSLSLPGSALYSLLPLLCLGLFPSLCLCLSAGTQSIRAPKAFRLVAPKERGGAGGTTEERPAACVSRIA